jgi:biopolymer transport protein ExbD
VPLIDVILVLIIFFVVTTTFDARSTLQVQLPQASDHDAPPPLALSVLINAEGRYFINDRKCCAAMSSRSSRPSPPWRQRPRQPVLLRADARTPYQAVVTAQDALGSSASAHRHCHRAAQRCASEPDAVSDGRLQAPAPVCGGLPRPAAVGRRRSLLEGVAGGAFLAMMKPVIDETFIAKNREVSYWLPLTILGLFLMRSVATWVSDYSLAKPARSVVRDLRDGCWTSTCTCRHAFRRRNVPSVMVSRLNFDSEQVTQAAVDAMKTVVQQSLHHRALAVMLQMSVEGHRGHLLVAPPMAWVMDRWPSRVSRGIQDGGAQLMQTADQACPTSRT